MPEPEKMREKKEENIESIKNSTKSRRNQEIGQDRRRGGGAGERRETTESASAAVPKEIRLWLPLGRRSNGSEGRWRRTAGCNRLRDGERGRTPPRAGVPINPSLNIASSPVHGGHGLIVRA